MTAKSLIAFLERLPPEMEVLIEKTKGTAVAITHIEVWFDSGFTTNTVHIKSRYPYDDISPHKKKEKEL
jgi:hypothetical protein